MKYIQRNSITDIDVGIIAHQVNCCNVMGSGVAAAISTKYPIVKSHYHALCNSMFEKVDSYCAIYNLYGKVQVVRIIDKLSVANIFTQLYYGNSAKTGLKYTNEDMLVDKIVELCNKYKDTSIYIPERIGCGLAGGNWHYVSSKLKDANLLNLIVVQRVL